MFETHTKRKVGIGPTPTAPQAGMLPLHNIRHIFSFSLYLLYKEYVFCKVCVLELKLELLSLAPMNKPRCLCIHDYDYF